MMLLLEVELLKENLTVRLMRTACKVLSKYGSEQSGVYQSFTSSMVFLKIHWLLLKEIALIFFFRCRYIVLYNTIS